jgi:hypothetical protein
LQPLLQTSLAIYSRYSDEGAGVHAQAAAGAAQGIHVLLGEAIPGARPALQQGKVKGCEQNKVKRRSLEQRRREDKTVRLGFKNQITFRQRIQPGSETDPVGVHVLYLEIMILSIRSARGETIRFGGNNRPGVEFQFDVPNKNIRCSSSLAKARDENI